MMTMELAQHYYPHFKSGCETGTKGDIMFIIKKCLDFGTTLGMEHLFTFHIWLMVSFAQLRRQ